MLKLLFALMDIFFMLICMEKMVTFFVLTILTCHIYFLEFIAKMITWSSMLW